MDARELVARHLAEVRDPRARREISSLLFADPQGGREFGGLSGPVSGLDSAGGVWSLSPKSGLYCGIPLVPVATGGMGERLLNVLPGVRCWGWTPPGELAAASHFGRDLIADVELRSTNKVRPEAGWSGRETAEAAVLASLVGGVTSHGFVLHQLRDVLTIFARAGCVAYPQVYDSDRSTEPRAFLRQCVKMYREAGFSEVRPLLGLSAGPAHVVAWLDECAALRVRPDLWQLSRLRELTSCNKPDGPRPFPPPRPVPAPSPLPSRPISLIEDFGPLLLLVAAGLLYSRRRRT